MTHPQRAEIQPHLERILIEEGRLLLELEMLLAQETKTLQGEDLEAIRHVGGARHRCVETLTRLDVERADTARMLSFGNGRGALEKLLRWADPGGALQRRWLGNLEIARRCKRVNDRNGALVTVKLSRVRQLLGKLRGTQPSPVYGRKGSRYSSLGTRDLGSA